MRLHAGVVGALLALGALGIGCGDEEHTDRHAPSNEQAITSSVESTSMTSTHKRHRAKRSRAVHGTKVKAAAAPAYVACDANITVKATTTTCPFAENVFYGYWTADGDDFSAYSPARRQSYDIACTEAAKIICKAGDGAEVQFSVRAVERYDQSQADAYADSHDLGPDADSDESDDHESTTDEPATGGITEPGENIPYYDQGNGYRVQCSDGTYSQSGGIQGACSHHGGEQ
jgi:hypothetical protein